jgi:hypothetical protein
MPKFAIKHLLISTTLIAIGTWLFSLPFVRPDLFLTEATAPGEFFLPLGGATLIGAGLFVPFKHPLIGAAVGFVGFCVIGPFVGF